MSSDRSGHLMNLASMMTFLMQNQNRDSDDDVVMKGTSGSSSGSGSRSLESFLSSNNSGDSKFLVLDRNSGMLMDPESSLMSMGNMGNMGHMGNMARQNMTRITKPFDEDLRQYMEDPYERDYLVEKLLMSLKEEF